jgi:hypothetical protein
MMSESQRLQDYLAALERAAVAVHEARQLVPDHGLDHAADRLRMLILQGGQRLLELDAKAATTSEPST